MTPKENFDKLWAIAKPMDVRDIKSHYSIGKCFPRLLAKAVYKIDGHHGSRWLVCGSAKDADTVFIFENTEDEVYATVQDRSILMCLVNDDPLWPDEKQFLETNTSLVVVTGNSAMVRDDVVESLCPNNAYHVDELFYKESDVYRDPEEFSQELKSSDKRVICIQAHPLDPDYAERMAALEATATQHNCPISYVVIPVVAATTKDDAEIKGVRLKNSANPTRETLEKEDGEEQAYSSILEPTDPVTKDYQTALNDHVNQPT